MLTWRIYRIDTSPRRTRYRRLLGQLRCVVTKLNAAGSTLSYSTYLGGNVFDQGLGIAVDSGGNAYVTGGTASTNFPTANPLQASNSGSSDAFVTKFNAAGNAHTYSTYLGGNLVDQGVGITADSGGNAYVTGQTDSTNFPTLTRYRRLSAALTLSCEDRTGADLYVNSTADTNDDACDAVNASAEAILASMPPLIRRRSLSTSYYRSGFRQRCLYD